MMLWLVVVWLPKAPARITGRRELQSCGSARFVAASSCYGHNSRNCYDDVPCSETCEGDGEARTSNYLNNCDPFYDVYVRSSCTPSPTRRPTPRPTPTPTPLPTPLPSALPSTPPTLLPTAPPRPTPHPRRSRHSDSL